MTTQTITTGPAMPGAREPDGSERTPVAGLGAPPANLSRVERDLIVRYMLMRVLDRLGVHSAPVPVRRRSPIARRPRRRRHRG